MWILVVASCVLADGRDAPPTCGSAIDPAPYGTLPSCQTEAIVLHDRLRGLTSEIGQTVLSLDTTCLHLTVGGEGV